MEQCWPPVPEHGALLDQLAQLIELGGAAHFLDAPVVAADDRAFPDPWRPTWASCESLLLRLLWHAHVDLDVDVDDHRLDHDRLLEQLPTVVVWTGNIAGRARFQVRSLGADAPDGLLAVQIGRAFAAWTARAAPYREGPELEVTARDGAIAAIYLGLGVLVAIGAAVEPVPMAPALPPTLQRGVCRGLSRADACFLLAVQAVVRAAPGASGAGVPAELATELRALITGLAPHRPALVARLGLDLDAPRAALLRDAAPTIIPEDARPERCSELRHQGQSTFRIAEVSATDQTATGFFAGGGLGAAIGIVLHLAPVVPLTLAVAVAGTAIGALRSRRPVVDRCVRCAAVLAARAIRCPGCGATITGRSAPSVRPRRACGRAGPDRAAATPTG
jgi:hypothetical protein